MTDQLFEAFEAVSDESSFMEFARALLMDREAADAAEQTLDGFRSEWANNSISAFFDAGIAWAESSDFGLRPGPKPANPWILFAKFLWAGRSYE